MSNEILTPAILNINGESIAPKTYSDIVFNSDGSTASDKIDQLLNMDYIPKVIKTTNVVEISPQQSVIEVPFPYERFDVSNSVILLFDTNNKLIEPDDYVLSNDQVLIINKSKYELTTHVTFIFIYVKLIVLGGKSGLLEKKTIVLDSTEPTVDIGVQKLDGRNLAIYKNGVYIEEGIDYTHEGTSITLINDNEFDEDTVLNIMIYNM